MQSTIIMMTMISWPIDVSIIGRANLANLLLELPWLGMAGKSVKALRRLSRGLADEGIYEVLDYSATLELLDTKGRRAVFRKRENVRYLQNGIIAYQDQAWGDGSILERYRCKPGIAVDQHRPGHKTYVLISLREVRDRGDIDEFNIEWHLHEGFVRRTELWETEVSHRTQRLEVSIVFPEARPPQRFWLYEAVRNRQLELESTLITQLPKGRWRLRWRCDKPQLNERYQLHWQW